MNEYIAKVIHEDSISICLYIEQEKLMQIGHKMNEICTDAYMNGYNWEAFFNFYLEKNHLAIFEAMGTDPEAGMYVAYFDLNEKNQIMTDDLLKIIIDLIENEAVIYAILQNESDNIEWD
jgi:hypothetical protein